MGNEAHSSLPGTGERGRGRVAAQGAHAASDLGHGHLGLCALQQPCFLGMWFSQPSGYRGIRSPVLGWQIKGILLVLQ